MRYLGEFFELGHFCADVVDKNAKRQHGVELEFFGADVVGDVVARIANHRGVFHILADGIRRLTGTVMKSCDWRAVTAWFKA